MTSEVLAETAVHVHGYLSERDADGAHDTAVEFPLGGSVHEAAAEVVAHFYHACDEGGTSPRLGAHCDEHEHQRALEVRPLLDWWEDDEGQAHVQVTGWEVVSGAPTSEGSRWASLIVCDDGCALAEPASRDEEEVRSGQ